MTTVDKLKRIRTGHRGIATQLLSITLPDDLDELAGKLATTDSLVTKLTSLDDEILDLLEANEIDTDLNEAYDINEKMATLRNKIETKMSKLQSSSEQGSHVTTKCSRAKVKLPQITLKSFHGDTLDWTRFWNSFESAIDQNEDLKPVDKFNYLIGLLEGKAALTIDGVSVTNAGYSHAVDLLKDRYGRKQVIINAHIDALLAIPFSDGSNLRSTFDQSEKHIRGLLALGISADTYGLMMAPILLTKFPSDIRLVVSRGHKDDVWDLQKLREDLRDEIEARERSEVGEFENTGTAKYSANSMPLCSTGSLVTTSKVTQCVFCEGKHVSMQCHMPINVRYDKARESRLCFICLGKYHTARRCTKRTKCKCGSFHHPSLCPGDSQRMHHPPNSANNIPNAFAPEFTPKPVIASTEIYPTAANTSAASTNKPTSMLLTAQQSVLMQTATVDVTSGYHSARAKVLFDTGSQRSFVTEDLVNRLRAQPDKSENMCIASFGTTTTQTGCCSFVTLGIRCIDNSICYVQAAIKPAITSSLVQAPVTPKLVELLGNYPLADEPTYSPFCITIDMLIGLEHYHQLVKGPSLEVLNGLILTGSKVGWLLSGVVESTNYRTEASPALFVTCGDLNNQLAHFWDLETIGIESPMSSDHSLYDVHSKFRQTTTFENGRYFVDFPWKSDDTNLPDNRMMALNRFERLRQRLDSNVDLRNKYANVIDEQVQRGFIEKVHEDSPPDGTIHYIAHHPVIKESSATTKVRVVYDASARKDRHSPSLNDSLYKGPDLTGELFGILLRFREYETVILADIEKAFLMIGLHRDQRDSTRFFWYSEDFQSIIIFRFTCVPFGVISSPFLLNATINIHLEKFECKQAKIMGPNFYVDNVVVSLPRCDTLSFYNSAKSIMSQAGMNLREWESNSDDVLQTIPLLDRANGDHTKVLGLGWDKSQDVIHIPFQLPIKESSPNTKRSALRTISSVYDPLGLVSPIVIRGKVFMQKLWLLKLHWESPIPPNAAVEWKKLVEELVKIPSLSIERSLHLDEAEDCQLHVFCDASETAYGAAVYIRFRCSLGLRSRLICSKSRVAPTKMTSTTQVTLPKLELLAATIGSRLVNKVNNRLRVKAEEIYLWSDSQITLHWVLSPKRFGQFVDNRVEEIRSNRVICRYVPTNDNPADLVSRGCTLNKLSCCDLWWCGPKWLTGPCRVWPQWCPDGYSSYWAGEEPITASLSVPTVDVIFPCDIDITQHTSLNSLIRITALCIRFVERLRHKNAAKYSFVTIQELTSARNRCIRAVQTHHFRSIIRDLKDGRKTNIICQLSLYIDPDRIVRCAGRLGNSRVQEVTNNPVLLPKNDTFTKLIIQEYHVQCCHSGVRHTLTALRSKYWVPAGRQAVKKIIRSCPVCIRWEGQPYGTQDEPPLPTLRVTESPAFSFTGVDYAGPMYLKTGDKVWICLFTCAVTRAVHLELVNDMTTFEFILALRRFMARRGTPEKMVSDNGKYFQMADKVLQRIWTDVVKSDVVQNYTTSNGINWIFNVERAPWWGGFFERLVGLVKRSLKKVLEKAFLHFRELETQLIEIEAVLNSRPLTFVYSEFNEGKSLTPNDLCGFSVPVGFPDGLKDENDPDYIPPPVRDTVREMQKRIMHCQLVLNEFWRIWRHEYLVQLREHSSSKRHSSRMKAVVGEIVLIKDDLPRAQWKLGRIHQLLPSRDGIIRAAVVKCRHLLIKRPVTLLYPLEVPNSEQDPHDDFETTTNGQENLNTTVRPPMRQTALNARRLIAQQLED